MPQSDDLLDMHAVADALGVRWWDVVGLWYTRPDLAALVVWRRRRRHFRRTDLPAFEAALASMPVPERAR